MERIIKSQALRNNEMDHFMGSKKILELNLDHKIIKSLNEKYKNKNFKNKCVNLVKLMFETALINSGFMLEKPSEYANKVNKLLESGFCEELINEELVNEELVNEELVNEELVNEELVNEELVNEELVNEELVNEELVNEELVDEKLVDEKLEELKDKLVI